MAITVSAPNNVESPSGNSLALYKDASTSKFYIKDINGQIEELPTGGGITLLFEVGTGANSTQRIGSGTASGDGSTISGGLLQVASGLNSTIGGGNTNTASGTNSTVGGGQQNIASGYRSFIGGGYYNVADGISSSVVCGDYSNTQGYSNAHIIGTSIYADRRDCTFVENLTITQAPTSAVGLSSGSVWNNGGVLNIVL